MAFRSFADRPAPSRKPRTGRPRLCRKKRELSFSGGLALLRKTHSETARRRAAAAARITKISFDGHLSFAGSCTTPRGPLMPFRCWQPRTNYFTQTSRDTAREMRRGGGRGETSARGASGRTIELVHSVLFLLVVSDRRDATISYCLLPSMKFTLDEPEDGIRSSFF